MPSLYNTKEEALARILEIVGSRIRLNAAQASYLRDCTTQQASEYLCSMSPDIRQYIINSKNNMEHVALHKANYLRGLIGEINILKDLGNKLESLVKDDSPANVFFVASELFIRIKIEEKQLADQRYRMHKQNKSLARAARSSIKKEDKKAMDSKKAAGQAAKEAVRSQPELQSLESRSELRTYIEIYRLLEQSGIITEECDKFCNEYFEVIFYGEDQHAVVLRNINRNKYITNISSLLKQIKEAGLNDVTANYMYSLHNELHLKEQKLFNLRQSSSADCRVIAAIYFLSIEIEILYQEIHKTLKDEVDRHKEEQKRMQEEVRAYEERLRIEEKEKAERTEIERQKREALIAEERARLDAEYVKSCAERVENTRKYRAQVEADKVRNEVSRRKRHIEDAVRARVVTEATDGAIKSSFTIDETILFNNADVLCGLLLPPMASCIKYREAVKIVHALGGYIETDTGSSHQRIFFGDRCYQDLNCEVMEDLPSTSESTLKHGFAKKSEITGYNLRLLRNAIISVLPDNYLELLQQYRLNPKNHASLALAKNF